MAAQIGLLLSVILLVSWPSFAMDISVEGQSVIMSGSVSRADCDTLGSVLSKNDIKLIVLRAVSYTHLTLPTNREV